MVAELVGFVNQHKVIFVGIPIIKIITIKNLIQTPIAHKFGILVNSKVLESCLPVLLHRRRIDYENLRTVIPVFDKEFLCYHCSNDSFTKTHDISEEEAIVSYQFLITFNGGIHLVFKLVVFIRNIERVVLVDGQHTVGEILHQHLDV